MTTTSGTMEILRGETRGRTTAGWLDSRHTFSFGGYRDPSRMGFGALRVINDDWIEPGAGFGEHPHRDMEILTWVLEGGVRHADSTGGGGVIRPGEVQAMTAGRGIRHSEFNASETARVHLLQVWIEPRESGSEPGYAQRAFDESGRRGRWQVLASGLGGEGDEGALVIGQDARVLVSDVGAGDRLWRRVEAGRRAFAHVATGRVEVNGEALAGGDGAAIAGPVELSVAGVGGGGGQVLLFELA